MPSQNSEGGTNKSVTKSARNENALEADQTIGTENRNVRHEAIAAAAYYRAEKRGFKGSDADAVQDWLEAEAEIDNESVH